MIVYKLTCKELSYTCIYDTIESMAQDIKIAIEEEDTKLIFGVESLKISRAKYDKLPESPGW